MKKALKKMSLWSALFGLAMATIALPTRAAAQDEQDDPPTRVARLGYMEGSVSFLPAGETDWVGAVDNRPLTTGDKLWADKDSRAELQLGSAVIRLSANTGISILNLDDHTAQIQLSSGSINVRVRHLDGGDDFEIDTPNLAFTISQAGRYRLEASEDASNTVVTLREGGGEATGNGQTYTLHAGQSGTFSGTDALNADVEQIGEPDQFDSWTEQREHRHDSSRSAQYLSHDVVGYDDLDENGDWHDHAEYGHVWFPHVEAGWAPYHEGHWAWIDPWGYTWVDDSPWGYAPFHYGRWASVEGRWGWIAGPPAERAVYAPALVVFVGGGGVALGGNIAWFALGPREVFVPSYHVSRGYMAQINVSNTTVNTTTVTNVYNTTIVNKSTTITNITYANRTVPGAVTAVPQHAFASAQPVARVAVKMTPQQIAAAPVSARVAVAPTREAVTGPKAATAGHVSAPPAAVANRQVIAKKAPPPPPPTFAARQQAMAAHPGQPVTKHEMAKLAPPASAAAAHPAVKVAPPGKPATPTTGHPAAARPGQPPANQPAAARPGQPPANQPAAARPGQPAAGAQPANRPGNPPPANERPGAAAQPNRPPAQPAPNNRPETNRPADAPAHPPAAPPAPNRPEANRPPAAQPNNRPETNRPAAAQPAPSRPEPNRPPAEKPAPTRPEANRPAPPPAHPPAAQPTNRPENRPPAAQPPANRPEASRPAPPPAHPPAATKPAPPPAKKPLTPEEKKREEEKKPPGE